VGYVRTLRRSTELANLVALCTFGVFGAFLIAVGIERPATILVVIGLLYAGGMAWYLFHLLRRVASELRLDATNSEIEWTALAGRGRFPLSSVTSVRQTSQPDVYAFVLRDGSLVRFWHRNRDDQAQGFFRELRTLRPDASFDALYATSGASWRRGLPPLGNDSAPLSTKP
jgi:hypothetical protein